MHGYAHEPFGVRHDLASSGEQGTCASFIRCRLSAACAPNQQEKDMTSYAFLARIAATTILAGFATPVFAQTIYTYTQSGSNDIVPNFQFTTSRTGALLNNLPPGTDISSSVPAFTFQPRHVPQMDSGGFPIGGKRPCTTQVKTRDKDDPPGDGCEAVRALGTHAHGAPRA